MANVLIIDFNAEMVETAVRYYAKTLLSEKAAAAATIRTTKEKGSWNMTVKVSFNVDTLRSWDEGGGPESECAEDEEEPASEPESEGGPIIKRI